MRFTATEIAGAWLIDIDRLADERGFFARVWCRQEFAAHGCETDLVQASLAYTERRGTLRGLHYQAAPHEEAKLVRCVRGSAYVVIADRRPKSASYRRWIAAELTADNRRALYVPPGCAQGYQTLADDTELLYQMTTAYAPQSARGIRHDDPAFAIAWPLPITLISDRDQSWPDYQDFQSAVAETSDA
jgi:dTDP-4-dehydrorhamnose 3,5-epimerase